MRCDNSESAIVSINDLKPGDIVAGFDFGHCWSWVDWDSQDVNKVRAPRIFLRIESLQIDCTTGVRKGEYILQLYDMDPDSGDDVCYTNVPINRLAKRIGKATTEFLLTHDSEILRRIGLQRAVEEQKC